MPRHADRRIAAPFLLVLCLLGTVKPARAQERQGAAQTVVTAPDGTTILGGRDRAWVAKRNVTGEGEVFRVQLGSDPRDVVNSVATGPQGKVYAAGVVHAFPNGQPQGFLAVLDARGQRLSTVALPGPAYAVAVDETGKAYAGGENYVMQVGGWKITPPGAVRALAVAPDGGVYAAGSQASLAETGSYGTDAYVARVGKDGGEWEWVTLLGGTGAMEEARAIVVAPDGSIYVAGVTSSLDFPVKNAYQERLDGRQDAFLLKLRTTDGAKPTVEWATYLGGAGMDAASVVLLEDNGDVVVAGTTDSPNFPLAAGWRGGDDGFLARFDSAGKLVAGGYLGGPEPERVIGKKLMPATPVSLAAISGQPVSLALPFNGFLPAVNIDGGVSPVSVAVGDFNGDGKMDLAVANFNGGTVSVLLGNGNGTFQAAVTYASPGNPISVAVGDFNGDGKMDLAAANVSANNVSVLLGVGNGTFSAAATYPTGTTPYSVAVWDFNGDGKMDLAVANRGSNNVSVLIGVGNGTFSAKVDYAAGASPQAVAVGDFNGDGKRDLVVANNTSSNVSVLLGNGNGTFQAPVNTAAGAGPQAVAVADFDGDGKADLAVGNPGSNVRVLLGNGNGTFQAGVLYGAGTNPVSVVVGDFNADGKADLAVANAGSSNASVLLGNGNGTLQVAVNYATGTTPQSVTVGDFNGDAKPDLAVANSGSDSVSILLGDGLVSSVGLTASPTPAAVFGQPVTLTAAVTAGATGKVTFYDGATVLGTGTIAGGQAVLTTRSLAAGARSLRAYYGGDAIYNASSSAVVPLTVVANPGIGFLPAVNYATPSTSYSLAAGDFNGDGKADLAVANWTTSNVSVLLGNGNGTFQAAVNYGAGAGPVSIVVGDFNGDGKADLAVANRGTNNVSVLLGDGNGNFQVAVNYGTGNGPTSIVVGDFNGDGKADLAAANEFDGNVSVLLGNGNGTFQAAVNYGAGAAAASMVVGDFNGDGKADLAVGNFSAGNVSVLVGNGNGTFQAAVNYGVGPNPQHGLAAGDFNGDGKVDLVTPNSGSKNVSVLLGNGNGTFQAAVNYAADSSPMWVAVGDFNGDGKADLAVANRNGANVSLLLGNGNGTFQAAVNYATGGTPTSIALADFNGDGKADLALANSGSSNVSVLLATSTVQTISPSSGTATRQVFTVTFGDVAGSSQILSGRILFSSAPGAEANACHIYYDRPGATLYLMNDAGNGWLGPIAIGAASSLQNNQCRIESGTASFTRPDANTVVLTLPVTFKTAFVGAKNIYLTQQGGASGTVGPTAAGTWTISAAAALTAGTVTTPGASGSGGIFSAVYTDNSGWQNLSLVEFLVTTFGSTVNCYVGFNPATNALAVGSASGTLGSGGLLNGGVCQLDPVLSTVVKAGNTLTLNLSVNFLSGLIGAQQVFTKAANQNGETTTWQAVGNYTVNTVPAVGGVAPKSGTGLVQAFTFSYSSPGGFSDIQAGEVLFAPAFSGTPNCYLYVDRPGNTVYLANSAGNGFVSGVTLGSGGNAGNGNCVVYGTGSGIVNNGNTSTITLVVGFNGPMLGAQKIFTRARGQAASGGLMSAWQEGGTFTVSISPVFTSLTPDVGTGAAQTFAVTFSDPYGVAKWVQMQVSSGGAVGTLPYCYVHYDKVGNGLWLYQGPGPLDFQGPITPGSNATLSNGSCTINGATSSVSGPAGPANTRTLNVSLTFAKPAFSGTKTIFLRAADQIGSDTGFGAFGVWTVGY